MKRFIPIILSLLLVFSISIPAYAAYAEDDGVPAIPWDPYYPGTPYAFIVRNTSAPYIMLYLTSNPVVRHDTSIYINNGYKSYKLISGEWVLQDDMPISSIALSAQYHIFLWTSHDIKNVNGDIVFYHDPLYFEGYTPEDDGTDKGFFSDFFSDIASAIRSLGRSISNLPNTIVNGITSFFVPNSASLMNKLVEFSDELKEKFNFDTTAFESLFTDEKPVEDFEIDYTIPNVGDFHFTVLEADWLQWGVEQLRPYLKGFIVLMLMLYNIRQLIGFFGYNSGVVAGRSEHIQSSIKKQGE